MRLTNLFALVAALGLAVPASAGFLIDVDVNAADSAVTSSPNFAVTHSATAAVFDDSDPPVQIGTMPVTPTASSSGAPNLAVGLAGPGSRSLFGGNADSGTSFPNPDQYTFTYTPALDGDNDDGLIGEGTPLNASGDFGFDNASGASGLYEVFVSWPTTGNISFDGLPANYVLTDGTTELLNVDVVQDSDNGGVGNEWFKLGSVMLDANTTYSLVQSSGQDVAGGLGGSTFSNGFVSMRASGAYFSLVPEPTSALLVGLGMAGFAASRRR